VAFLAVVTFVAVAAPVLPIPDPRALDLTNTWARPSAAHPLGTDSLGKDLLARLIWGSRTALFGAGAVTVLATIFGTLLGVAAAWRGGLFDATVSRAMDVAFAFPSILLALLSVAVFGQGMRSVIAAIAIAYTPYVARLARASAGVELGKPYVASAQVLGISPTFICWRHVTPNIAGVLVAQATVNFGYALIDLAALSYLGFGVQRTTPDWGVMVAGGQSDILQGHPQEALYAGLAIVIVVLAVTVLGDRLERINGGA
jgi:peptide/nickel transport system permease protein